MTTEDDETHLLRAMQQFCGVRTKVSAMIVDADDAHVARGLRTILKVAQMDREGIALELA